MYQNYQIIFFIQWNRTKWVSKVQISLTQVGYNRLTVILDIYKYLDVVTMSV